MPVEVIKVNLLMNVFPPTLLPIESSKGFYLPKKEREFELGGWMEDVKRRERQAVWEPARNQQQYKM